MEKEKPLDFLLVKPAGPDCNLACTYCFYSCKAEYFGSGTRHRMSDAVLETMMRKALGRPRASMGFGWQGGEPTLAGLDFFKKAIELQKIHGRGMRVSNALQTNGMLIDDEWIAFLREYSFLVGLSLDGPQHVHDHYRLNHGQVGSHAKVEQAARAMLAGGVAVNAISVVSDYSSAHAAETYSYLKGLGFEYLQFIPCVEADAANPRQAAPFSVTAEQYGEFLCTIFDLWEADWKNGRPTVSVRMMDTVLGMYLGGESAECPFRHTCGDYLVVEHTGEIYSCDFFVEDAWRLGSLSDDVPLQAMLNGKRQQLFSTMKSRLPDACKRCAYLHLCHGGCTKDRIRDPRDKRLNHFCAAYKRFFGYTAERFQRLADAYTAARR
jgi:uncharacterized protein